jgi:XapX domain-containing protein
MMKLAIAYVLAFMVGMFCRYFEIPAPAPPAIPGVLLVVAMTLGYVTGDKILPRKKDSGSAAPMSSSAKAEAAKVIQK